MHNQRGRDTLNCSQEVIFIPFQNFSRIRLDLFDFVVRTCVRQITVEQLQTVLQAASYLWKSSFDPTSGSHF